MTRISAAGEMKVGVGGSDRTSMGTGAKMGALKRRASAALFYVGLASYPPLFYTAVSNKNWSMSAGPTASPPEEAAAAAESLNVGHLPSRHAVHHPSMSAGGDVIADDVTSMTGVPIGGPESSDAPRSALARNIESGGDGKVLTSDKSRQRRRGQTLGSDKSRPSRLVRRAAAPDASPETAFSGMTDPQRDYSHAETVRERAEATRAFARRWKRTKSTLDDFVVAGVNLAAYGFEDGVDHLPGSALDQRSLAEVAPFELFSDFDIGNLVMGTEEWWTLQRYKQFARPTSLSFYVDKIAQKRWLPSQGYDVPKAFALRYAHELVPGLQIRQDGTGPWSNKFRRSPQQGVALTRGGATAASDEAKRRQDEVSEYGRAIKALFPKGESYCAKPSHLSLAQGVWLVDEGGNIDEAEDHDHGPRLPNKPTSNNRRPLVGEGLGRGMDAMKTVEIVDEAKIAASLAYDLYRKDPTEEVAQLRVKPGVVVEERYTLRNGDGSPPPTRYPNMFDFFDRDDLPAMEFKVFTIWGRVWMAHCRRGVQSLGYIHRNGTTVLDSKHTKRKVLPRWVNWPKIVEMAERRARHMDLLRVDIFAGIPAGNATALRKGATREERRAAIRLVLSEVEMQTTSKFDTELEEEGARLWIAGYKMGNFKRVPNTEVPAVFSKLGYLPESWTYSHTEDVSKY